jgi:hypothetical protein
MKTLSTVLAACAVSVLAASSADAQLVVFNNLSNPLNLFLDEGTTEAGDMIQLAGGQGATIDNFTFSYYLNPAKVVGGETVDIRFYDMTGAQISPTDPTPTPGTKLYDSGPIALSSGLSQDTLFHLNVAVPAVFTWSAQFSGGNFGVPSSQVGGVTLYSPPTVGQDQYEYWENVGGQWQLTYFDANPTDFGALITAVPEPGATAAVLLISAAGTVALLRRRRVTAE